MRFGRPSAAGADGRDAAHERFQVNRDAISAGGREYFRRSVGLAMVVAPDTEADSDGVRDQLRRADWVFSGLGSPSYALGRRHTQRVGEILHERVNRGCGVSVMASAAAYTVGFAALPVYEASVGNLGSEGGSQFGTVDVHWRFHKLRQVGGR
ncbi:hypothetical protein ACFUN8_20040 [Streptomyces sp. NPDC057307]|uniref:hypothetical protein n=1 Tax=Streptomyces sp. NPDC057307 TaxID=3346096 RepID=UPI00363C400C